MKTLLLLFVFTLHLIATNVTQLFSVQTIKVEAKTTRTSDKNYGYVRADETQYFDITPRFGGYVVKLHANNLYQEIKKGDPLLTLYSPEVYKAKDEYLNAYRYTQKSKNPAMMQSAKQKLTLLGVAQKEIDAISKENKSSINTTIYAPSDGTIFIKNIHNGSAFKAQKSLFTLINLDTVWVEMQIFEEQRAKLRQTIRYDISFKGVDTLYHTKQSMLYPNIDNTNATLTLRLKLDNTKRQLFPGMYATIQTIFTQKPQLTLPRSAVIRKNGAYYVFMVGDFKGEYEPREVKVVPLDTHTYSVQSGLSEGDEVVNNALFMQDSDAQINGLY
jgi:membrane fusion protein, copper/silver efflux system